MLDLEYVIKGITEGTVSIINVTTGQPDAFYNDIEPCKVKLDRKYDVVRLSRDKLGNRYDYCISVIERPN